MGSGVPCGLDPMPYCDAKERAENCEPADVGLLALPSRGPKLPDLECAALLSLPPLADWPGWAEGRGCSYGATVLPIGVATCTVSCGRDAPPAGAPTGFTLGEGGIASPSLGVRAPLGLPPARAGRRGPGEADMMGIGVDVGGGGVLTAALSDAAAVEGFMAEES